MTTLEIITAIIAAYGATLSTWQLLNNRASFRLTVRPDRFVGTPSSYYLRVTNRGRRPITITTIGVVGLYPTGGYETVGSPILPCEITEGRFIDIECNLEHLDSSQIDYWIAWDSQGRIDKWQEASQLARWKSRFQLK